MKNNNVDDDDDDSDDNEWRRSRNRSLQNTKLIRPSCRLFVYIHLLCLFVCLTVFIGRINVFIIV